MGFRCFLNCKKAQGAEPSRRPSRFLSCILPPKSRSVSPAARSTASQSPNRASSRSGEMSLRREVKDDNAVEASRRLGTQLSISVELEEVFKKFDANGDGKLSSSELGDLMRSLGCDPTEEDLGVIMSAVDLDGDGYIDLSEFLDLNTEGVDCSSRLEDLKDAFKLFDKDGDGSISPHELREVLTSLRELYTMDDCEAMIKRFDCNGDGVISFDEFTAMMSASEGSSRRN